MIRLLDTRKEEKAKPPAHWRGREERRNLRLHMLLAKRIGSVEPAAAAISLIDKRIRDLMMVREKQIRTPGSTGSTANTGGVSEVVDEPTTSAPRRTRGKMKKILPTPPLFRESVDSGPSATEYDSGGYVTVRRRSRRRRIDNGEFEREGRRGGHTARERRNSQPRRVPPKAAAVTITGITEEFSYADALSKARERIPLADLGIQLSRIRHTVNGGRLIEIPGPDGSKKADDLAIKLREVLGNVATVSRPVVKGEMRLVGLDDSVSLEEVKAVIAREGDCDENETMLNGYNKI